jgi:hypothetical protein
MGTSVKKTKSVEAPSTRRTSARKKSTLPAASSKAIAELLKKPRKPKKEGAEDVAMLSPVSEASAMSLGHQHEAQNESHSDPRQQGKGIIIASESSEYMVDLGFSIEVMSASDIEGRDFQMDVDEDNPKFNSPADWTRMQQLKKDAGNQFYDNINNVRSSEIYGRNKRTCFLNYQGESRDLRCSKSNMAKLITEKRLKEFLEKANADMVKQALHETHSGLSTGSTTSLKGKVTAKKEHDLSRNAQTATKMTKLSQMPTIHGTIAPKNPRDKTADYIIIAKDHRRGFAQQVTDNSHCILQNKQGLHESMKWSEIKEKQRKGEASFDDRDFGHGLHAHVDQEFLKKFKGKNKLNSTTDFDIDDAIMYHSLEKTTYWTTVFITLKKENHIQELQKQREKAGYQYDGPIRSSPSTLLSVGGARNDFEPILEKRQPEMLKESKGRKEIKREILKETYQRANIPQAVDNTEYLPIIAALLPKALESLSHNVRSLEVMQASWIRLVKAHKKSV